MTPPCVVPTFRPYAAENLEFGGFYASSCESGVSSRALTVLPIEDDARGLRVTARTEDSALIPTHWSFGQLCSLASPGNSPASYFRDTNMPTPMIADCLNYNLRFTRGVEDIGVLLTTNEDGSVNELR